MMFDYKKKKRIRKFTNSPIVLILLFLIFILLIKGVWSVYQKEKISAEKLRQEKTELEKLTAREKTLANSIDFLKTDQGIENEIRTKFRAVRENENVVVIVDRENGTTSIGTTTVKRGFWSRIFGR